MWQSLVALRTRFFCRLRNHPPPICISPLAVAVACIPLRLLSRVVRPFYTFCRPLLILPETQKATVLFFSPCSFSFRNNHRSIAIGGTPPAASQNHKRPPWCNSSPPNAPTAASHTRARLCLSSVLLFQAAVLMQTVLLKDVGEQNFPMTAVFRIGILALCPFDMTIPAYKRPSVSPYAMPARRETPPCNCRNPPHRLYFSRRRCSSCCCCCWCSC